MSETNPTPNPNAARIKWDQTGERSFELGVSNAVLYPQASNGTYPLGVAWNGITSVTESPEGAEPNDLWADDMKYASLRSAETFGATIEAYMYPDEFAVCDGSAEPEEGVYLGQQSRTPFGLCYKTKVGSDTSGDNYDYKLHLIYNATASPSEKSYETINDSPDAITFSWEVDTTPINVTGHKAVSTITIDSRKVDDADLKALEDALYGTDPVTGDDPTPGSVPYLPLPDAVIAFFHHEQADNE